MKKTKHGQSLVLLLVAVLLSRYAIAANAESIVIPVSYELAGSKDELLEIDMLIHAANLSLNDQSKVLTIAFSSNNDMKSAIDAAFKKISNTGKMNIATIILSSGVTEITGYNWKYLIDQYNKDSGWDSLMTLDLSGLTNLAKIGDDVFNGCEGLNLKELPSGLTEIGDGAFYSCESHIHLIMGPMTASGLGYNVFPTWTTLYVPKNGTGYNSGRWKKLKWFYTILEYTPATGLL